MNGSKWYLVYFLLAGFDLVTILFSLTLNHNLLAVHNMTVRENREWADRLSMISRASESARAANVAANDVFATGSIEHSKQALATAADRFFAELGLLRSTIERDLAGTNRTRFLKHLEASEQGMRNQQDVAREMFSYLALNNVSGATTAMASVDRHNAQVGSSLADAREEAEAIQAEYFDNQTRQASNLRTLEYFLVGFIVLMVAGAVVYGTRLTRTANTAFEIIENQRREETRRAAQMSEVAKLATGVAHELRNPLTSVKLLVQSASNQGLENHELEIVGHEISRMERSLNSFLDYARPPKMKSRPFDFAATLRRVEYLLAARAARQNTSIHVEGPGSVVLKGDEDQLEQLFLNLCQNSLDAMPEGGTLTVAYEVQPPTLIVKVADTGPGIAEDIRARIFEPFTTNKETGVGLGLVISKQIAQQHGGDLSFHEDPTCAGACFVVTLST